ncbi:MAG: type II toxin-antitoxin system RatA family toxin, partial [Gammaproteobacteria bacterium]|nr:type II toxin-antitoxin system RatA family toxin [Gammaproteobacteria bacterium]
MKVERSALLPYSAAQMFAIIRDIRSYPSFLNWCDKASIEYEDGSTQRATLWVSYGKLKLSFSSQNSLVQNEKVGIDLLSGPFKTLKGEWNI